MIWNESTIILAIIGMVGLFSTAVIYQRSNRITSRYYSKKLHQHSSRISSVSMQKQSVSLNSMLTH